MPQTKLLLNNEKTGESGLPDSKNPLTTICIFKKRAGNLI